MGYLPYLCQYFHFPNQRSQFTLVKCVEGPSATLDVECSYVGPISMQASVHHGTKEGQDSPRSFSLISGGQGESNIIKKKKDLYKIMHASFVFIMVMATIQNRLKTITLQKVATRHKWQVCVCVFFGWRLF